MRRNGGCQRAFPGFTIPHDPQPRTPCPVFPSGYLPGLGSVGEYALYTIMPQARLRYPLLDGRLQPYALAGVGVSVTEFSNGKPRSANLRFDAKDLTPAGAVGAGIEYFVTSNIAVNFEAKYNIVRGHVVKIEGLLAERSVLDSVYFGFGLRIFLAQLGG